MIKNEIGLKFLVVLSFLAIITGCSNKKDDVKTLKEELAKTQEELQTWQRKYEAISLDLKDAKASQRDLGTKLGNVDDTSKTIEERLQFYAQQVTNLQAQVQELNATINEQEAIITEQEGIIADQEAALQEFTDTTSQPTYQQPTYGY